MTHRSNFKQRYCSSCDSIKNISEFSTRKNLHNTNTIYYVGYCRACMNRRMNNWVEKNLEKYRKYQREYQRKLRISRLKFK